MGRTRDTVSAIKAHPVRSVLVSGGFTIVVATFDGLEPKADGAFQFGLHSSIFFVGLILMFIGVAGPTVVRWFNNHIVWRFALRRPDLNNPLSSPQFGVGLPQEIEPDVPLVDIVRRIVAQKGGLPDDKKKQEKLAEEVNREIASKVKFKNLTVYGSSGNQPPEKISYPRIWRNANVDVLKMRVWFPGSWSIIEYVNIMFISNEIDKIWPPTED